MHGQLVERNGPAVLVAGTDGGALQEAANGPVVFGPAAHEDRHDQQIERGCRRLVEFHQQILEMGTEWLLFQVFFEIRAQLRHDFAQDFALMTVVQPEDDGYRKAFQR